MAARAASARRRSSLPRRSAPRCSPPCAIPRRPRRVRELGADHAILYKDNDWAAEVKKLSGGVDVVLDMVAGDYLPKNLQLPEAGWSLCRHRRPTGRHGDDQRRPADGESTDAHRLDAQAPKRVEQGPHGARSQGESLATARGGQDQAHHLQDLPAQGRPPARMPSWSAPTMSAR